MIEAKQLIEHGHFEKWCDQKLSYSKSKAEKLMVAAQMISSLFKSGTITVLPAATIAYQLSAPSTPAEIRDNFLARLKEGEKVGPELTRALKAYRAETKSKSLATSSRASNADPEPVADTEGLASGDSQAARGEQDRPLRDALAVIRDQFPAALQALSTLDSSLAAGGVFTSLARKVLFGSSPVGENTPGHEPDAEGGETASADPESIGDPGAGSTADAVSSVEGAATAASAVTAAAAINPHSRVAPYFNWKTDQRQKATRSRQVPSPEPSAAAAST